MTTQNWAVKSANLSDFVLSENVGKMKKYLLIITILIFLFILIYSANFYFLSRLSSSISFPNKYKSHEAKSEDSHFPGDLNESNLKSIYKVRNPKYEMLKSKIMKNFVPCSRDRNYSEIWEEANSVSNIFSGFLWRW